MTRPNTNQPVVPARVQAALDYLEHCRWLTEQDDAAIPARSLSPKEERVMNAALQVLSTYFLGEMDFGDAPPRRDADRGDDDDNGVRKPEPAPKRS